MAKAKTFSREAMQPPKGLMPTVQYCLVDQLEVDETYQRSIENNESQALIAHIALHWHWGRAQLLNVSRRDGRLFVVDGQHRLQAARLRGDILQLPCLVEEFASVAEEAALFDDLNGRRRPVSALDKFRAALVAGDPDCTAIGEAMGRAGLSLARHGNPTHWKPGEISNIGGVKRAWKSWGAAATELALTLLADAFRGEVLTYAGTIFPGLAAVCAGGQGKATIEDDKLSVLIGVLGSKSQLEWRKLALREMASTGEGLVTAMAVVLRRAIGDDTPAALQPDNVDDISRQIAMGSKARPEPAVPVVVGGEAAAFGDRFDRRAAGYQFCAQCDKQVSPEKAKRCTSAWCKVRDLAA